MQPSRGSLLERVSREEWNIGVIRQTAGDIVRRGITHPVHWLEPMHPWYGFADPGCYVAPDESRTVFAERLNYLNGRGEIWAAQLPAHAVTLKSGDFKPWARANTHLSYPFPIAASNSFAFTMETGDAGKLYLWQNTRTGWITGASPATKITLLDRPAIDPTLWRASDRWWLFCTFADNGPDTNLYLFHAPRLEGPWTSHPFNPVKSDLASARPAGPLFRADGRLIRPSQDSTQSYGSAVVLNAVTELTPDAFREQPVRRLVPQNEYPDGLHTICPAGDVTIIDGKRWGFNALDPVRYLVVGAWKRLRRLRQRDLQMQFLS